MNNSILQRTKTSFVRTGSLFQIQDEKKIEMFKNRPNRRTIENESLSPRLPCLTIKTNMFERRSSCIAKIDETEINKTD